MTGRRPPRSSRRDTSPSPRALSSRLDSPATASSSRAGSSQPHRRLHRKKQPVLAHGLPFEDPRLLSDWPIEVKSRTRALDKANGKTPLAAAIASIATAILARRQNERQSIQPDRGSTGIPDQQRSGHSQQHDEEQNPLDTTAADTVMPETNGSPSPAPSSRSASSIEFHSDDEQSSRPAQRRQDSLLHSASPSRLSDASSSTTWDEDLLDRSNDHAPELEDIVPPSLLQPLISVVQTKLNRVLFDLSEKREAQINPRRARTRKLDCKDVLSCLDVQHTLPVGDEAAPPPYPLLAKVRRRLEAIMSSSSIADEETEDAEAGPSRLEAEASTGHTAAASSPVRRFPQGRSELDAFLLYDRYPNEVQESKKRKRVRTKDKQRGSQPNAKSAAAASASGRSDAEVERLFEGDEQQLQSPASPPLASSTTAGDVIDEDDVEDEDANRPPVKKRRVRDPPPRPIRDSRSGLLLAPAPSRSSTNRRKKRQLDLMIPMS